VAAVVALGSAVGCNGGGAIVAAFGKDAAAGALPPSDAGEFAGSAALMLGAGVGSGGTAAFTAGAIAGFAAGEGIGNVAGALTSSA